MSFRQCPKKLWLQTHRPELAETDSQTEANFATGHEVGAIARRLYDNGAGIMIEYEGGMPAALAHINKRFVYQGDGDYQGLLVEQDITAKIAPLRADVPLSLARAKKVFDAAEPEAAIGTRCWTPYDCPSQKHCWKETDYPLTGLPAINSQLNALLASTCGVL